MQEVTIIQTKLAKLMIFDGQGQHLDEITKEIKGKHGIEIND